MKNVKIIVATHKPYKMPDDEMYLPVHVGAAGKDSIGYQRDDEGENISEKNPYFCELTGLHWAWKNCDADYIGLAHYRRHFATAGKKNKDNLFESVLSSSEADTLLNNADIILSKKRNYYIENLYDHYKHTMYVEPLDETRKILEEKYPEYLPEFDKLHTRTSAHMFNMAVMKRDILDEYCSWIFEVLFELEKRIDPAQYEAFHARYPGRISELMLDVWINTNNKTFVESNVMDMEPVNWFKKGFAFVIAKFTGKKYGKSF